jgi:Ca2+-binding RTX toxin-like protein
MAKLTTYNDAISMTSADILTAFASGPYSAESATKFVVSNGSNEHYTFTGTGFTFDAQGHPTGGTITHLTLTDASHATAMVVSNFSISVADFSAFATANDLTGLVNEVFANNDTFNITSTALARLQGAGGNDTFNFGANFGSNDAIDGGAGVNTAKLAGDYTTDIVSGELQNIQKIMLGAGHNYDLTLVDTSISGGKTLTVDGHTLAAANSMAIDASAQTVGVHLLGGAGNDTLVGGTGNDQITGGLGADTLTGGGGKNTFIYASAAASGGAVHDTITDFDAKLDHFKVHVAVNAIDAEVTTGALDKGANFNTELQTAMTGHLLAGDAVLFTPDSGTLSGHTFLIVDQNGAAGYQSGHDLVIDITGAAHLSALHATNFIT